MITLSEAKLLKIGDVLLDSRGKRWRVNGAVKLWKRPDPTTGRERIRIPLKHGLYAYDYIGTHDFNESGECDLLSKES